MTAPAPRWAWNPSDTTVPLPTPPKGLTDMVIESPDYEATRRRLMRDAIVQSMARGCLRTDPGELGTPGANGGPTHDFMLAALREYQDRAGHPAECHIGGVAEAILRLLDMPTRLWPEPDPQQLRLPEPATVGDLAGAWRDAATQLRVQGHKLAANLDREGAALAFARAEEREACATALAEHLAGGMIP